MLSHFSHVWLWDTNEYSPPGSSVHGIIQARILEWVAMPSSRGSSWARDQNFFMSPALADRFFTGVPPGKPYNICYVWNLKKKKLYKWTYLRNKQKLRLCAFSQSCPQPSARLMLTTLGVPMECQPWGKDVQGEMSAVFGVPMGQLGGSTIKVSLIAPGWASWWESKEKFMRFSYPKPACSPPSTPRSGTLSSALAMVGREVGSAPWSWGSLVPTDKVLWALGCTTSWGRGHRWPGASSWDRLWPGTLCCSACTWTKAIFVSSSNKIQRNLKGTKNHRVHVQWMKRHKDQKEPSCHFRGGRSNSRVSGAESGYSTRAPCTQHHQRGGQNT